MKKAYLRNSYLRCAIYKNSTQKAQETTKIQVKISKLELIKQHTTFICEHPILHLNEQHGIRHVTKRIKINESSYQFC